jgi:hypothetical protein
MTAQELLRTFRQRKHCCVYHACTITTFRSYCALGAYASRQAVEEAGLSLTPQFSDEIDRERGLDDRLFLNVFDQHGDSVGDRSVFGLNKYGPVLMVFTADALERVADDWRSYRIEITDPGYTDEEHEIVTMRDFVEDTFRYTVDHAWSNEPSRRPGTRGPASCLFNRDLGGNVAFEPYLIEVVLDRLPDQHARIEHLARKDLKDAIQQANLDVPVKMRDCVPRCGCRRAYEGMTETQVRRFFYVDNIEVYGMPLPRYAPDRG